MTVIAIDFGTTNTFVAQCPAAARAPSPLQLENNHTGIDTAVLYADEDGSPYIGELAVATFGNAAAAERQKYRYQFHSHFKPDLATNAVARQAAVDFLRAFHRDAQREQLPFAPSRARVIFGVPSEADAAYRQTLAAVARDAGYGEIELADEPLGALLDGVAAGLFPLSEILRGFLVIDFGGGTCDFAFLRDGKIHRPQESWGDMHLGGRWFDDLFYRWFAEQNPVAASDLEAAGDDFFLRTYWCRQAKEKFSALMSRQSDKKFSFTLGRYGALTGLTWDEFLTRARNYEMTDSCRRFYRDNRLPEKLLNGKTDLLQWFADALVGGLRAAGLAPADIKVIALAGGSSQWKFVADFCREQWGNEKIFRSPQPYAAIATGLAILPALQREFAAKQQTLSADKPRLLTALGEKIQRAVAGGNRQIVAPILAELFDEKIRSLLTDFRERGGKIADLEAAIEQEALAYAPRVNELVKETMDKNARAIGALMVASVRAYLQEHGLRLGAAAENYGGDWAPVAVGATGTGVAESLVKMAERLTGLVGAAAVASLCGGGGTALIAAGPLGLIIGGVIGVAAAALAAKYGREKATALVKNFPLPKNISPLPFAKFNPLKLALGDDKIAACREKMGDDLTAKITAATDAVHTDLIRQASQLLDAEIARLNVVHLLH
ncbi:hypothetical protein AGMMS49959_08990 [Planctomycetales bacterium]|nr:hypothetical protein AGMMS49959_08990 [Planctomycetales bacterium]